MAELRGKQEEDNRRIREELKQEIHDENVKMRTDVKAEIEQANDKLRLGIKGDFDEVAREFAAVREEMKEKPEWANEMAREQKDQFAAMMAAINGTKEGDSKAKAPRKS